MPTKRCIIAVAAAFFLTHTGAEEIRLVTVGYPPYYGPGLPNQGPIAEIVVEAYATVGYQVDVEFMPWVRAMQEAKTGKADGLLGGWYSKEREQWFVFSNELPGNEIVLYNRKGDEPQTFTSYGDLKSFKIGTVRGYRNPPEFEAANLRTEAADSDKVNLIKLAKARVDLILIDRATAKFILARELIQYSDSLEAIEPPLENPPLYVLISRQTSEFQTKVDAFNRGLKFLEKQGTIQAIMERHGM